MGVFTPCKKVETTPRGVQGVVGASSVTASTAATASITTTTSLVSSTCITPNIRSVSNSVTSDGATAPKCLSPQESEHFRQKKARKTMPSSGRPKEEDCVVISPVKEDHQPLNGSMTSTGKIRKRASMGGSAGKSYLSSKFLYTYGLFRFELREMRELFSRMY